MPSSTGSESERMVADLGWIRKKNAQKREAGAARQQSFVRMRSRRGRDDCLKKKKKAHRGRS